MSINHLEGEMVIAKALSGGVSHTFGSAESATDAVLGSDLDTELEYADDSSDTETSFQLRLSASAMFMYDLAEHVALRAGFDMGVLLGEWGDEDLAYKHGLLVSTPLLLVYRF